MKSLNENLSLIKRILVAADPDLPVYHYQRPARESLDRYVVWAEDSETNSLNANNRKEQQQVRGTIDLYTLQEFDPAVDLIQEGLNTSEGVGWVLSSVQYEDETNLIHYEWTFAVI